mgnify:FL=1
MSDTREKPEFDRTLPTSARSGRAAVDKLVPLIYDELRRIAHHRLLA